MMKRLFLFGLLMFFGVALFMETAEAIPAFARKYRMSCTTCHSPFPRLKDYGDEFAGNGFILSDQDAPGYFVDTGDEHLSLIRNFPIAVRVDMYAYANTAHEVYADYQTPYVMKLISGGSLTEDIAYYFYSYLDERGEVAGIDDAFIMFNNLLGHDLDVYVGQFAVSDPLLKSELRLSYENYMPYRVRIGESLARLSYDRGVMVTLGLPTGTDIIGEVVNGNGLSEAENPEAGSYLFDNDEYKAFVGRVAQDVGGLFSVGGFVYYTKEASQVDTLAATNEVTYIGVDAAGAAGPVDLAVQYLMRDDSYPTFGADDAKDVSTTGIIAEVIYWPHGDESRWYLFGLYNSIDSDLDIHDYQTATLGGGYLIRRNIRLVVEGTQDMELEEMRGGLGLVIAF
jgi:hypothetical protein